MQYGELIDFLQNVGKDPSRLIFEDELTGLHNRRFLLSYFEHKVHWDQDEHFPLSLLILDVDLFKTINDTYGHDAGDQALVFIAGLLKEVAGEDAFPVRFGGDEFMVLLPRTELSKAVMQVTTRVTKPWCSSPGSSRRSPGRTPSPFDSAATSSWCSSRRPSFRRR